MKIGYYPGCSLLGTALEYNESLHEIAKAFDIELAEIKDWNCCGATAAHNLNHTLSVALPARTLALAEDQGFDDIVVPCAACYNRLLTAWHDMKHDLKLREKVSRIIEMPIECKAKPMNVLDFLEKYIMPELKKRDLKPFTSKSACYYGCLLARPAKIMDLDRYEDPMIMDDMMKAIGSKPIDWAFKTECCGASLSIARTDIVAKLSGKIVIDAIDRGAESIVVACPMCQSNLDMRRTEIEGYMNKQTDVPVIYITQAIGLALGIPEEKLGFKRHMVPVEPMIRAHAAAQAALAAEAAKKAQTVKEEV